MSGNFRKYMGCLTLLFLVSIHGLRAQGQAPKYSNEFLAIGVGARGLGMAGAQVALVDDVSSGYWNPAGLNGMETQYEGALMHASYFAGIANYDYLAFATQIDSSNYLAISAIRFAVDDIPDTRFLYDANGAINYDNIRFFSAADYAFLLTYAREIKGLRLGANAKVVHRIAGPFANAWGFGFDLGAQYTLKKWQFGATFRDVTGTFNAWSHSSELLIDVYTQTGNEIPDNTLEITLPRAIFGVARRFDFFDNQFSLLGAIDLETTFDGARNTLIRSGFSSIDPRFGLEAGYKDLVFLRGGLGRFQQILNFDRSTYWSYMPAFGIGLALKGFFVDYALTDIGDRSEALYSHVFSLKISFDEL